MSEKPVTFPYLGRVVYDLREPRTAQLVPATNEPPPADAPRLSDERGTQSIRILGVTRAWFAAEDATRFYPLTLGPVVVNIEKTVSPNAGLQLVVHWDEMRARILRLDAAHLDDGTADLDLGWSPSAVWVKSSHGARVSERR